MAALHAARTSDYQIYRDPSADPAALVCVVGKRALSYHLSAVEDLHAMLLAHADRMELGSSDEQKPTRDGTVEAWARSSDNPVGGWTEERVAGALRDVRPTARGTPRADRARAPAEEQPRSRPLIDK